MDAVQQLQQLRLSNPETRQRNKAGPVVAEAGLLRDHGLRVVYGHNLKGQRFAAIYRGDNRLTNWARL